jgi:hypothetical protein
VLSFQEYDEDRPLSVLAPLSHLLEVQRRVFQVLPSITPETSSDVKLETLVKQFEGRLTALVQWINGTYPAGAES